ncbi:MAG: tryptophan--tRNA ligase [Planctomycetota bacterium]|jgi:tryptophanyl-tRNA synthetase
MRILSGVQPSGKLHLGNYFGAIRQFVELQKKGEAFYFIANLHALTTIRDSARLRELTLDVALDFLALGVDPEQSVIFVQSDVPEVTELSWILSTVTPMGLLERAHSYKDKLAKGLSPEHGLFAYPVLMAADILAYDADLVPVGKDQKQHLEITRDLAVKLNLSYAQGFDPSTGEGGVLTLPDPYILDAAAVVPGTDGQKMSKSYGNTIELFAANKQLKKSVMRIVTDSTPLEDPKDPGGCNVFALLSLFCSADELAGIDADYRKGGVGYGHFKKLLLEKIHERFDPARERREELARDSGRVLDILEDGARRARAVSTQVLERVKEAVGVGYRGARG